jgi:hypothetical protein
MKKDYVLGVLFFSGLWGISEAVVGDALYRTDVPYASVPLTVIGFAILTFARVYFPQKGTATIIACCAMLYKFLNAPFFACHLLGIFLTGVCYDLVFGTFRKNGTVPRRRELSQFFLCAAAATYLSYALFALMMTYVFQYGYWGEAGFGNVLRHIGIGGSAAALGCAVFVPLSFRLGEQLKAKLAMPFKLQLQPAAGSVSAVTAGLWVFGIAVYLFS